MMDRELLELAAKAIGGLAKQGQEVEWQPDRGGAWVSGNGEGWMWAPLTDDGDAQRLAVKLNIAVIPDPRFNMVHADPVGTPHSISQDHGADPFSATRRAIVRAAAEIGRGIQQETTGELPEDNFYKTQAEAEEIGRAAAEIGKAMV